MTVWLTGVRKSSWQRDDSAVKMVTLHVGGWSFGGRQTAPTFLEGQNDGSRQGSPVALRRADELGDLIDGTLIVVMRCL
jgi:hypothetical protein